MKKITFTINVEASDEIMNDPDFKRIIEDIQNDPNYADELFTGFEEEVVSAKMSVEVE